MEERDLFSGFIRLHILHHAAEGPIFGLWIIDELARHRYKLSPGTLYPLLHGMEKKGYLHSAKEISNSRIRRVYTITPAGERALELAKSKIRELFGELLEE